MTAEATIEVLITPRTRDLGDGFMVRRALPASQRRLIGPFIFFDQMGPARFAPGQGLDVRPHPHIGLSTVTYLFDGEIMHRDSLGTVQSIRPGEVNWMTAGRGILHQEMPQGDAKGRMHGFQLWANLPSSLKMTAPCYQDVKAAEIPEIIEDDGTRVRVVCGEFFGKRSPVEGVAADPRYLDIWVPPGVRKTLPVELERHAFAYVFEGSGDFRGSSQPFGVLTEKTNGANETLVREQTGNRSLVLFDSGDEVTVQAGDEGIRFLLVSGKPIEEPVAWYGPIVMNTEAELQQAFGELRVGTFIR